MAKAAAPPPRPRFPWRCRAAALATFSALSFGAIAKTPAVTVPVVPERLSPHAYAVIGPSGAASAANQGFMSNAGFVITGDGVVLFDTLGTPALGAELRRRIGELTPLPIRKVVVSHYHPDHFYGLEAFRQDGVEIVAHVRVHDYLASDAAERRLIERRRTLSPWIDQDTHLIRPDRSLTGDHRFSLGGLNFRIFHVGPAHTPEDLVMLLEEDGVLFVGDLLFGGRLPFVGESDSRAWLAAIDRILEFHPKIIVAGHGRHSADAMTELGFTRDYLLHLRNTMGRAVADFEAFESAYAGADWAAYSHLPLFHESNRINAYNTYLLMEKESLQPAR